MVLQILIISLIAYLSIIVLKSFYYRYKANSYLRFLTQNINSSKSNKKTKIDFNENKKDSDLKDATILTSATGIYSIYDLYETCDNHDEILTMLANSYSKEIGTNASPFLIHQKLLEISRDPERLKNLMDRRLTGDYGEIKYLEFLKENFGDEMTFYNANIYEGKQVPGYDIIGINNKTGIKTRYSSKNYAPDNNNLIDDMRESIEQGTYIQGISTESYNDLKSKGLINELKDEYRAKGIEIEIHDVKNLRYYEGQEYNKNTVDEILDSGDWAENFAYLSILFFGIRGIKNTRLYMKGDISKDEYKADLAVDTLRFATIGVFGAIGGWTGGLISETLGYTKHLGQIVGGFLGMLFSGKLFSTIKSKWKWGKILKAQDFFSKKYPYNSKSFNINKIANLKFNKKSKIDMLKKERNRLKSYSDSFISMNIFSRFDIKPDMLLSRLHFSKLKTTISVMNKSVYDAFQMIYEKFKFIANKSNNKKIADYLWGEFVILNNSILFNQSSNEEKNILDGYEKNKKKSPNYPNKLKNDPSKLLDLYCKKAYVENSKILVPYYKPGFNECIIYTIILGLLMILFNFNF